MKEVMTVTSGGRAQKGGHVFQVHFANTPVGEYIGVPLPPVVLGRLFCGCPHPRKCRCIPIASFIRHPGYGGEHAFLISEVRGLFGRAICAAVLKVLFLTTLA